MQLSWIFFNYIHIYMNSIMDAVKCCLFRKWAMKSLMTPHMWQWHWDWVLDTSRKEQTFYTFRVEIGFCAKGVRLLGGLGACPSPQEIFQIWFLSSGISCILASYFWYYIRSLSLSQISLSFSLLLSIHLFRIKKGDFFYYF